MLVTNWLTDWLTNWLTHFCLVNFIDLTLVCEDNYSKFVEVVTVADVDEKDRVGNSLLQIWKLKFGQYFAADVWLRLRSWILVNNLKLGLVKILSSDLVEILMFVWDFEINA